MRNLRRVIIVLFDFSIRKRLTNLPALREIGFSANPRLLRVQLLSHDPITGADALHRHRTGIRVEPRAARAQPRSTAGASRAPCKHPR